MSELTVSQAFGYRAQRRRQVMGFTQRHVATAIGMAAPQYSKLEAGGISLIRLDQFIQLVAVLETSADYLFGLTDSGGKIPLRRCVGEEFHVYVTLFPRVSLPCTRKDEGQL